MLVGTEEAVIFQNVEDLDINNDGNINVFDSLVLERAI